MGCAAIKKSDLEGLLQQIRMNLNGLFGYTDHPRFAAGQELSDNLIKRAGNFFSRLFQIGTSKDTVTPRQIETLSLAGIESIQDIRRILRDCPAKPVTGLACLNDFTLEKNLNELEENFQWIIDNVVESEMWDTNFGGRILRVGVGFFGISVGTYLTFEEPPPFSFIRSQMKRKTNEQGLAPTYRIAQGTIGCSGTSPDEEPDPPPTEPPAGEGCEEIAAALKFLAEANFCDLTPVIEKITQESQAIQSHTTDETVRGINHVTSETSRAINELSPELEGTLEHQGCDNAPPEEFWQDLSNVLADETPKLATISDENLPTLADRLRGIIQNGFENSFDEVEPFNYSWEGRGLRGLSQQVNGVSKQLGALNKLLCADPEKISIHQSNESIIPVVVEADEKKLEFKLRTQLVISFVEKDEIYRKGSSEWHLKIPNPKPGLTWDDIKDLIYRTGNIAGRVYFDNSSVWSGGYFLSKETAMDLLSEIRELSASSSGEPRLTQRGIVQRPGRAEVLVPIRGMIVTYNDNSERVKVECLKP